MAQYIIAKELSELSNPLLQSYSHPHLPSTLTLVYHTRLSTLAHGDNLNLGDRHLNAGQRRQALPL